MGGAAALITPIFVAELLIGPSSFVELLVSTVFVAPDATPLLLASVMMPSMAKGFADCALALPAPSAANAMAIANRDLESMIRILRVRAPSAPRRMNAL